MPIDFIRLEKIYLKMLYTDNLTDDKATDEYRYLLMNHNPERLAVERAARQRNLRSVLYNDMILINSFIDKNKLLEDVIDYCSDFFINNTSGRSLVENFCYFMYLHGEQTELFKSLYKIQGVYSGVSTNSNLPSPWLNHQIESEEYKFTEIFDIPLRLNTSYFSKENKNIDPHPGIGTTECKISKNEKNILIKFTEKS